MKILRTQIQTERFRLEYVSNLELKFYIMVAGIGKLSESFSDEFTDFLKLLCSFFGQITYITT